MLPFRVVLDDPDPTLRRWHPDPRPAYHRPCPIPWWKTAVAYQIYPRSFLDTDGDGVGDLEGIRRRLDHLAWLGVDALWLSPVFRSPMADFGYDVSDYCDVDPVFGDLDALDALVADAHARDLRVILDWVPNHSSDQHPWFRGQPLVAPDPKRDWYVWRDGPGAPSRGRRRPTTGSGRGATSRRGPSTRPPASATSTAS